MGRRKIYTKNTLRKAVKRYFDSITREVELTEKVPTEEKDDKGHVIFETRKVKNCLEEVVKVTEYLVPPTLEGLCRYLGIHASTWSRWAANEDDKYKEFSEIIEDVRDRLLAWRKEQVLIRKDVKGMIWDLEVNYGCKNPVAVRVSGSVEDFLKRAADEGEGGQRF